MNAVVQPGQVAVDVERINRIKGSIEDACLQRIESMLREFAQMAEQRSAE
ncbi:hypothetical protein [Paenibacillus sp. DMB20]|nr:hypothetical protein [Paenibacillus sp. DMB20]